MAAPEPVKYTAELIINGELVDAKKLDNDTLTALVAYFEGLQ